MKTTDGAAALKPATIAPEAGAFKGLCSACALAEVCTFPRDPVRKIIHCEEFEAALRPDIHLVPPPVERARGTDAGAKARALMGLCADCTIRESCTFPKPVSGVWHCEEYA